MDDSTPSLRRLVLESPDPLTKQFAWSPLGQVQEGSLTLTAGGRYVWRDPGRQGRSRRKRRVLALAVAAAPCPAALVRLFNGHCVVALASELAVRP
jgi:hypothetical protein